MRSKNNFKSNFTFGLAIAALWTVTAVASVKPVAPRQVISLDGQWQITKITTAQIPKKFDHTVPVPGLVDMAEPAFEKVGFASDSGKDFWYRKTFSIEGPVPAVAILKINKAKYGTHVYINGHYLRAHLPSYTPSYFDLAPFLKGDGEENELVIRIGGFITSLPRTMIEGGDGEKYRYIPGIYDSVQLILTNPPYFQQVQVAPNPAEQTALVAAKLLNPHHQCDVNIQITVRETKSGKVVYSDIGVIKSIADYDEYDYSIVIPIKDCRLWSPEDPFLYELELKTDTDGIKTRFGMRSFRFDKKTGRAVLNGKPYYMRGTNVCIFRFFEDELRGDKPWQKDWVRRLHEKFKDMNWNSIRYSIGFPPDFWYDIADEVGILIQDEFPLWGLWPETKVELIASDYADWMRQRWNHPCVVIWDANNETAAAQTRKAIGMVRHLDLSNRPWDNGFALPQSDQDCLESHPYQFHKGEFKLSDVEHLSPVPSLKGEQSAYNLPIIINEYSYLWVDRQGNATSLTKRIYDRLLGPDATNEQRRQLYAKYTAALTEFWRAHRKCAGVMHFLGLGYSRDSSEGGATSDPFIDIDKFTIEPNFEKYVKDSFAPVGLMLDFWKESVAPSTKMDIPVYIINDLYEDWKGHLCLTVQQSGTIVSEQETTAKVVSLGQEIIPMTVQFPSRPGNYEIIAEITGSDGLPVRSYRDVLVTE